MTEPSVPLTVLSEDQRAQAHTRLSIIRPALEDGVTQVVNDIKVRKKSERGQGFFPNLQVEIFDIKVRGKSAACLHIRWRR